MAHSKKKKIQHARNQVEWEPAERADYRSRPPVISYLEIIRDIFFLNYVYSLKKKTDNMEKYLQGIIDFRSDL